MFRDLFRSQGYTNNNSSLDWDWNRVDSGSASGSGADARPPDQHYDVGGVGGDGKR